MIPSPLSPAQDPRAWSVAPDYPGMQDLVAGLEVPAGAAMGVMGALETSKELIRHSYYRYEFATVAVTHALFALEQVLVERLAVEEPLRELIGRAAAEGLLGPGLVTEIEESLRLRDELARGTVTTGAVPPGRAVQLVRPVFDAVSALLRPPVATDATGGATDEESDRARLDRLWEEHRRSPFPRSFLGVDIARVCLILLEDAVASAVLREQRGGFDHRSISDLWHRIADLDKVVPLIDEQYCREYFARLRTVAGLVAASQLPPAT
ncbi:hypothetical protein [Kitasatospora sp. NPDC006786]|uniref:hypothetical protein n=1 Tax=unclassified Kitasatospora TaxID=2633591 RepID=UPI003409EE11